MNLSFRVQGLLLFLSVIVSVSLQSDAHGQLPNSFVDQGDGTIKNTKTGLLWLKDPSSLKRASSIDDARKAVSKVSDGSNGLKDGSKAGDWRLPTPEEAREVPWSAKTEKNGYVSRDEEICPDGRTFWPEGGFDDTYWGEKSAPFKHGHLWPVRSGKP